MRIARRAFDRLVEQAIAQLPPEFAEWLEEVPVIVEDRPGKADREHTARAGADGEDEESDDDFVGLYVGRPMGEAAEAGRSVRKATTRVAPKWRGKILPVRN